MDEEKLEIVYRAFQCNTIFILTKDNSYFILKNRTIHNEEGRDEKVDSFFGRDFVFHSLSFNLSDKGFRNLNFLSEGCFFRIRGILWNFSFMVGLVHYQDYKMKKLGRVNSHEISFRNDLPLQISLLPSFFLDF